MFLYVLDKALTAELLSCLAYEVLVPTLGNQLDLPNIRGDRHEKHIRFVCEIGG
jgi:hypothetical protein